MNQSDTETKEIKDIRDELRVKNEELSKFKFED
jgi:hypothetical protein